MGYPTLAELLSQSEVILELFDDVVALTGGLFELPSVHNLHCTSHVFYDSLFLHHGRRQAYGGSVRTHHGRNEIVGDWKHSRIHPVLSHQQAPREALLYAVQPIARRGLCDLHSLKFKGGRSFGEPHHALPNSFLLPRP